MAHPKASASGGVWPAGVVVVVVTGLDAGPDGSRGAGAGLLCQRPSFLALRLPRALLGQVIEARGPSRGSRAKAAVYGGWRGVGRFSPEARSERPARGRRQSRGKGRARSSACPRRLGGGGGERPFSLASPPHRRRPPGLGRRGARVAPDAARESARLRLGDREKAGEGEHAPAPGCGRPGCGGLFPTSGRGLTNALSLAGREPSGAGERLRSASVEARVSRVRPRRRLSLPRWAKLAAERGPVALSASGFWLSCPCGCRCKLPLGHPGRRSPQKEAERPKIIRLENGKFVLVKTQEEQTAKNVTNVDEEKKTSQTDTVLPLEAQTDDESPWDSESISENLPQQPVDPFSGDADDRGKHARNTQTKDLPDTHLHLKPAMEAKDCVAKKAVGIKDVKTFQPDWSFTESNETLKRSEKLMLGHQHPLLAESVMSPSAFPESESGDTHLHGKAAMEEKDSVVKKAVRMKVIPTFQQEVVPHCPRHPGVQQLTVLLKLGVSEPEDLSRRVCHNREWSWHGDLH
ncbi:uncharacterized protein LOC134477200 [Cavia porcellus]|uniref:uncharacterized protein LOC134477200 n=1 Tax=Cavia porcellus TaxID=10141 RepID=UPI002FE0DBAF